MSKFLTVTILGATAVLSVSTLAAMPRADARVSNTIFYPTATPQLRDREGVREVLFDANVNDWGANVNPAFSSGRDGRIDWVFVTGMTLSCIGGGVFPFVGRGTAMNVNTADLIAACPRGTPGSNAYLVDIL